MRLGLDELIIVNPGDTPLSSDVAPSVRSAPTAWFLGADGGIYRLAAPSQRFDSRASDAALGGREPVPRYFLGDDGILYETR